MSDEPKKRSRARTWILWTTLAVVAAYQASIFPVLLACRWLVWFEVLPTNGHTVRVLSTAYAPVVWTLEQSPALSNAAGHVLAKVSPPESAPRFYYLH
ncbi:MAG TPA: hypothetical protein VG055_12890 [Planctomycetaceae bacterium]|jgi:hypothetical protein|nr:hypothetical protein [Planctomycetaceae bacterium]